jgi:hypothetical protein
MPTEYCESCNATHRWEWEEAFDKFGFNDGDGLVMTYYILEILENAGYETDYDKWGLHNVVITSIKKDGKVLMSRDNEAYVVGYDDPRGYLPEEIINLLDKEVNGE